VKTVMTRIHVDPRPTDGAMTVLVERLPGLGATVHQDLRGQYGPGTGWVTMLDPEGNEFCVLRSEAERPDPYAHLVK
jgi:hypothetical protein